MCCGGGTYCGPFNGVTGPCSGAQCGPNYCCLSCEAYSTCPIGPFVLGVYPQNVGLFPPGYGYKCP